MRKAAFFGVADVARPLRIRPRVISDLFAAGKLDVDRCPVVAGRRVIPADYAREIETMLREAGVVKGDPAKPAA